VYTHVSKCKNDKRRKKRESERERYDQVVIGVFRPWTQTPGFHISGLATHPNTPNTETNNGESQRKEILIDVAQACQGKKQDSISTHLLHTDINFWFKYRRKNWGQERRVCTIIKQSQVCSRRQKWWSQAVRLLISWDGRAGLGYSKSLPRWRRS
jgi:hypothetical protein